MADPSGGQGSRASNAIQKRQESLRRWTNSETAQESSDRSRKRTKIQFSLGTVLLSAVSSGDVEEVKKFLAKGADINHQNVDGLTALHQACIDENYDLVVLLVDQGARLDIRDNEGWTPLHAAASCGSVEIAQYLLDNGADVAAVNNEGELPLDLAEEDDMEDLLTDEIERLGIDPEIARNVEEQIMLEDVQSWLNGRPVNDLKDRSGATALHVAASKGYLKVISFLLQLQFDINAKDLDGWTPLHAAAHWGQKDACELLSDHGANFSDRNKMGQTPIDVAEPEMVKFLEELKKSQIDKPKINNSTSPVIKSNMESAPPPLKRSLNSSSRGRLQRTHQQEQAPSNTLGLMSSITRIKEPNLFLRDINQERATLEASREQNTSPKSKLSRPPSFSESPKEDKENDQQKRYAPNKEATGSGSESGTEESSDESSEEESEEEKPSRPIVNSIPPRAKVTVNSLPSKPAVNSIKNPTEESESEESDSETEESSDEEEQEPEPAKTAPRTTVGNVRTSSASLQSAPLSLSRPGIGGTTATSKSLRSPFLDNDRKANTPSSPVSKYEPTRTFGSSRLADKEDTKEDTKSRLGNYTTRTTAATTSTASSTTTTTRSRIGSTPSEDSQARISKAKRVTRRVGTSYVGSIGNKADEEEENTDRKTNDIGFSKAVDERKDTTSQLRRSSREELRSSTRPSSTTDSYLSRRNRLSGTVEDKDKNEADGSRQNPRLAARDKDNEEPKVSGWKARQQEREREREKEREKEKEKEKEKDSDIPSYRRTRLEREKEKEEKAKEEEDMSASSAARARRARRIREKRRGGAESDEEEGEDSKKNTKINEDADEKPSVGSRRRSQETRQEDAKANAVENDPQKLKERLQEAELEVQALKIKLEKMTQQKEELARKYSNAEEDLKELADLRSDNQRLRDENGALIRVISKLSRN